MFFVDLKVAFNKVDRNKLWKELRKKKSKGKSSQKRGENI